MPTVRKEIVVEASPEAVWAAVRDVGAVHERLASGFVTDVKLEEGSRLVTFANGMTVRELIVSIDDARRRLAYSAVGGRATHHNASMEVLAEAGGLSRIVWITDLLPEEMEAPIRQLVEQGSEAMKRTLEGMSG